MNKVFSFAKIAGKYFPVMMVIQMVLHFTLKGYHPIPNLAIEFLCSGLWIYFFVLLIKNSAKSSPIVPPSWIAISGYVLSFISACVLSYATSQFFKEDWDSSFLIYFTISNAVYYASSVAIAVAFIWFSKFFEKGTLLKAMAIVIAVLAIIHPIFTLIYHPWQSIEDESVRQIVSQALSVFWIIVDYVPPTVFFLAFSKLKK